MTAPALAELAARHTTPHWCWGIDPILGEGQRMFGASDGVLCDAAALLSEVESLRRVRDRFIHAANVALMIREALVATGGNLTLIAALEPLRHATLETEADLAATEPTEVSR